METTYVAESEERLRHELEEKGIFVLTVHGSGAGGFSLSGLRLLQRRKIPAKDFLLFNQELATLLKAGLPLVQSLDILRKRIKNPLFKSVDDIYEKVRSGTALRTRCRARRANGVYTASLLAGEKSGSLRVLRAVRTIRKSSRAFGRTISAISIRFC